MHPFAAHFVQSGKTRAVCSYNELRRKIQKPVLLRLRLAASEKPVLNAPASACVAETRRGGERWNRLCGAKSSCPVPLAAPLPTASTAASAGIWSTPRMVKSARPAKRSAALSRTS